MNPRLHKALSEASELRSLIVLALLFYLRARRWLQTLWGILPIMPELLVAHWQRRVNAWLIYFLYRQVHWIKR